MISSYAKWILIPYTFHGVTLRITWDHVSAWNCSPHMGGAQEKFISFPPCPGRCFSFLVSYQAWDWEWKHISHSPDSHPHSKHLTKLLSPSGEGVQIWAPSIPPLCSDRTGGATASAQDMRVLNGHLLVAWINEWMNGSSHTSRPWLLSCPQGSMQLRGPPWHREALRWVTPGRLRQERICQQWGRAGFNPWVGKIPWEREWLSTPVFWSAESHGQRSLVGYSPWDVKESDKTEQLTHTQLWEVSYEGLMPKVQLTTCNQKGTGIKILFSKEEIKSWTFLRNNKAGWLPSWSSG